MLFFGIGNSDVEVLFGSDADAGTKSKGRGAPASDLTGSSSDDMSGVDDVSAIRTTHVSAGVSKARAENRASAERIQKLRAELEAVTAEEDRDPYPAKKRAPKKAKRGKDPDAPKRPQPAFFLYKNSQRYVPCSGC